MPDRCEIVVLRPAGGGVGYVGSRVAAALRELGHRVNEQPVREGRWPLWSGLVQAGRNRQALRRASTVHVELGSGNVTLFWCALVARAVSGVGLSVVAHDAPVMVKDPGSGLLPGRAGLVDAVRYKLVAPLTGNFCLLLLRAATLRFGVLGCEAAAATASYNRPVILLRHGTDPPRPSVEPSKSDTVLFGGYLGPGKGVEDLLEAWAVVGRDHPEARLVIAGTHGAGNECWYKHVRAVGHNIPNPPTWLGFVTDEDLSEVIAEAAIVVLPYRRSNPASGILMRSLRSGRAVIATAVPAVLSEVTDGLNGRVVPPMDPLALAQGLDLLLEDKQLRDALGAAAQRKVEHRSWAAHVEPLDRLYS